MDTMHHVQASKASFLFEKLCQLDPVMLMNAGGTKRHKAAMHAGGLDAECSTTCLENDWASCLVVREDKVLLSPVQANSGQLSLNLLFLDCAVGELLHVIAHLQQLAVQQVLQLEDILGEVQFLASDAHHLFPVPGANKHNETKRTVKPSEHKQS